MTSDARATHRGDALLREVEWRDLRALSG